MAEDKLQYKLIFQDLLEGVVAGDKKGVIQLLKSGLLQPESMHQLPPDIPHFTGRQVELEQVKACLQQAMPKEEATLNSSQQATPHSSFPISSFNKLCIVTGIAGVGKSTLAIHAAHKLDSDFPDAQLYINLGGTESQSQEPLAILASFLRALGIEDGLMPETLKERTQLYRSLLSNKRALILLDNARDEAQISPLLPDSPNCGVLATTRKQFTNFAEATVVDLEVMAEADALAMLRSLVGLEPSETELEASNNLINLCHRLPLAIRITSGILRNQPNGKIVAYTHQLADERQRLTQLYLRDLAVRASLTLNYQELDATAARLFRLLGLLNGLNFSLPIAAALLDVELTVAKESVEYLVERQLLEPACQTESQQERYCFHDMVRSFARGQLAQEELGSERQAGRLRVARWYLENSQKLTKALNHQTRQQLTHALVESKEQSLEAIEQNLLAGALHWFEIERSNLLASLEWAYQAQAWDIVVPFAKNLVNFFDNRAYWADWERTQLWSLEATRELGNAQEEAYTLTNLGKVYFRQGDWGHTIDRYRQSLSIFQKLGDSHAAGMTWGNLANIYSQQGDWLKARDGYEQSLNNFRKLGDRNKEGQTLVNTGILYAQQGNKQKAVDLWQEALSKLNPELSEAQLVAEWLEPMKDVIPEDIHIEEMETRGCRDAETRGHGDAETRGLRDKKDKEDKGDKVESTLVKQLPKSNITKPQYSPGDIILGSLMFAIAIILIVLFLIS
ncbi:MAG: tetratricopeptide repeat protein [Symploca sp. SIO1C2]|nr:tetratricopeptide repeat protein [Symploca sp. SIO1C2]